KGWRIVAVPETPWRQYARSEPQMPPHSTAICTSPGPGSGWARSTTRRSSTPWISRERMGGTFREVGTVGQRGAAVVVDGPEAGGAGCRPLRAPEAPHCTDARNLSHERRGGAAGVRRGKISP